MSCYFQMGHDTENLVGEVDLDGYSGIILSPVNRGPDKLRRHLATFKEKGEFDTVLDPQLYFPRSKIGRLSEHPYYPSDIETADLGNKSWWKSQAKKLADYAYDLGVTSVASPAPIPKTWGSNYYGLCAEAASSTAEALQERRMRVLTTVVVSISDLTTTAKPFEIASILSRKPSAGYYVVFVSDADPRRELSGEEELFGMLTLVRELASSGSQVLVSHCSSDMLLFKYAGAEHCATGKFFNLRRFTKSRYDEPTSKGGGQIPYWFEHSLLAFLRQADVLRLRREGHHSMLGVSFSKNHWGDRIEAWLSETPDKPWLKLSWRQYLSWFAKAEAALSKEKTHAEAWLKAAEANWQKLAEDELLFDEPRNNGAWIRPWRQALIRFRKSMR